MKQTMKIMSFLLFAWGSAQSSTLSVKLFREDPNPVFVSVDYGQKGDFRLLDGDQVIIFNSGVAKIKSLTYHVAGSDKFYQYELNQPGVLPLNGKFDIADEPEDARYEAPNYRITLGKPVEYTLKSFRLR